MPEQTYRVRIVRAGVEFEAEGDKAFVLEMLKRFETETTQGSGQTRLEKDEGEKDTTSETSIVASPKGISIREFIHRINVKKHTDITLAFGYFLEHHSGLSEFTPADINNCYYEAKMESSNTSQMLIQNIKRGFVMESKGGDKARKRFTLTNSGEQFIESKLKSSAE